MLFDNSLNADTNGYVLADAARFSYSSPITEERWVYLAKNPEAFSYDLDGNLEKDGRWKYTWDAENRLVAMEHNPDLSPTVPEAARVKLVFVYDYMGRRVGKKVYTWNTQTSAYNTSPDTDRRFAYDGWNLIVESEGYNRQLQRIYTWGLDLSGSLQGAGGIGGLVFLTDLSGGTRTTHYPGYDGNGNLTSKTNASDGKAYAQYEYSPYGQLLTATGSYADTNPIRFSTKYTDEETQLAYFGYRYYNSDTGRWLNRDPMEEKGGINLYMYINNIPIFGIDFLGMRACWPYRCYFCGCMDMLHMPYPSNWYEQGVTLIGLITVIDQYITTFGARVTLGELVGAGVLGDWALVGSGCLASAWVGAATGCAANAAGDKLADAIFGCCPDKTDCEGFSYIDPP